jgi:diguanylate cyclase (GGDEF)-like protein
MPHGPRLWPVLSSIILFWLLAVEMIILSEPVWLIIVIIAAVLIASILLLRSYIKSSRELAILQTLESNNTQSPDNSRAYRMLVEILANDKKPLAMKASEIISQELQTAAFAIFFKDGDKFTPRVYAGINKTTLANPIIAKFSGDLKNNIGQAAVSRNHLDLAAAFKPDQAEDLHSPLAFSYSWARGKAVFVISEGKQSYLSEILTDSEFNRVFWPGLENLLKTDHKLQDKSLELRQAMYQFEAAQKNINSLNKELKNKLLDLKSFVKISNDLYSLFEEGQLFATLEKTICEQLETSKAGIMVPSSDGGFEMYASPQAPQPPDDLKFDSESELYAVLSKINRPLVLPLAGSGLKRNEPSLNTAISHGYQVISIIKTGGHIACLILVGEKQDKSQFTALELDFLSIIGNIASLSLDNIQQYLTIEKLSYTDSMTGVYNYRYFYKRLNEEILRAKRYERELSLVIMDIDNFKSFNDNFGHQAGDMVLKQLSDLITNTIRSIDVVSRYGGEEFCIIMPDTGYGNCATFIERLRLQIANFKFESELFKGDGSISVSVGGAVYPHHAHTADRLIYCADMTLLRAKSGGRNRAIMFEPDLSPDANSIEGGINERHQQSFL